MIEPLKVVDIDYWEWDAFLQAGERRFYFQFNGQKNREPSVGDALNFLVIDPFSSSKEAIEYLRNNGYV